MSYATNKKEYREPKTWEIFGVLFGYFATAKDVPTVLKILKVSKLFSSSWKQYLLEINSSKEFWYLLIFTILLVILFVFILWREKTQPAPQENNDNEEAIETFDDIDEEPVKIFKRSKGSLIIGHTKTLGLSILRNIILSLMKVDIYGTFKRPSTWKNKKGYYNRIDRITYCDSNGVEFQYSNNFFKISFRKHPHNSDTYNNPVERKPTCREILLLLIASNFFPFWFIPHVFIRISKLIYTSIKVCCRYFRML